MASKKNAASPAPTEIIDDQPFVAATEIAGAFDLSAKLPVWAPAKVGKVAIKGRLLGKMNLPSAQANQQYWTCFVIKLTASTKVVETNDDGTETVRAAHAGEWVLVTATAVLSKLDAACRDRNQCFEVYLMPNGTEKTKSGGTVNLFSPLQVGNPIRRTPAMSLPSSPDALALPEGPVFEDTGTAFP